MSKRMLIMVLALVLLVAAGALVYINSTSKTLAAAEDCEDKPKPKDEFALAAECDARGRARRPGRDAGGSGSGHGQSLMAWRLGRERGQDVTSLANLSSAGLAFGMAVILGAALGYGADRLFGIVAFRIPGGIPARSGRRRPERVPRRRAVG